MFWKIGDIKNIFDSSHSHLPKLKTFSQKICCKKTRKKYYNSGKNKKKWQM